MNSISTRFLLFQLMAGIMALSFVACGSDDEDPKDNSDPVIDITKPSDNDQIIPGTGDLIVAGTLSDNVALSLCTITLEYTENESSAVVMNDDQLKSNSEDDEGTLKGIDDDPWAPDTVEVSLSGENYDFEEKEDTRKPFGPVPADIKFGEYTLTLEVEDEAGNTATEEILLNLSE